MHLKKTAACPRTMLVGSLSSTLAGTASANSWHSVAAFDILSLPGEVGGRGALDVKLEAALGGLDQPGCPRLQVDLTD